MIDSKLIVLFALLFNGSPASFDAPNQFSPDRLSSHQESQDGESEWMELFNGKDLDGWTPKIRHSELGDNYQDTFRVEDGLLKVGYEGYDGFGGRFGHLFYKDHFSHYVIRVEYRFVGEQCADGPGWAFRNSGIMVHGQAADSMAIDQEFPVSIEVQLLGGDGQGNERHNANLCTPGTHVEMNGELFTPHCYDSSSKTYHGDVWVTVEVEVRGGEVIRHWIDGENVLEYQRPQLDPNDPQAKSLIQDSDELILEGGSISIQSESHPIEFRKIELRVLESE